YDRQVCDVGFAAGIGTPVQYIFDRTAAAGAPAGSQYLAISLSGAEREMQMSVPALRERYLPALRELLPRAAAATVELFVATRERARAGGHADRGRSRHPVSGVVIAAPLRLEAALVASAARGAAVTKTGMGPERAIAAAGGLARQVPGALLVLGFCGGLDSSS